jgi:glycosyl hydrolase family 8
MLLAVYMNDQTLFDNLWLYEQQNLDSNGLMNWAPNGPASMGCANGATDADEDMGFALLMAAKQWGGQGMLKQSYEQSAIAQIQTIWAKEIFSWTWVQAGDQFGTNANINISYLAPAYYRAFAAADPLTCPQGTTMAQAAMMKWGDAGNQFCDRWWGVLDQAYTSIGDALNAANGNATNGLVPGWCNDANGAPCTAASNEPFNYQYDACRTPFRIGLDWCWNGETRAQAYLAKISSFFSGVGAANIVDGYALNGSPQASTMLPDGGVPLAAPFVGPAAVGAMSSGSYQQFLNDAYTLVAGDDLFVGGEYYASSWTVMSLLMMTGSFLDYTQETPTH